MLTHYFLGFILLVVCVVTKVDAKEQTSLDFFEHPLLINNYLQRCEQDFPDPLRDAGCRSAFVALQEIRLLLQQAQMNPEAFGREILEMEMQTITLQDKINAYQKMQREQPGVSTTVHALQQLEQAKALEDLKLRHYLCIIRLEGSLNS